MGWEQWTFGLPIWLSPLIAAALAIAALICVFVGGRARSIVLAGITGFLGVCFATGLASPPWWALPFLFTFVSLVLVSLCCVVPAAVRRFARQSTAQATPASRLGGLLLGCLLATLLAMRLLAGSYTSAYPGYVGYRDAPAAARVLLDRQTDFEREAILITGAILTSIDYYIYRASGAERVLTSVQQAPRPPDRIHVFLPPDTFLKPEHIERIQGYRLTDQRQLPQSRMLTLEREVADGQLP